MSEDWDAIVNDFETRTKTTVVIPVVFDQTTLDRFAQSYRLIEEGSDVEGEETLDRHICFLSEVSDLVLNQVFKRYMRALENL